MQLYYAQTVILDTLIEQLGLTYVMFRYLESHTHIKHPPCETLCNERVAIAMAKRLLWTEQGGRRVLTPACSEVTFATLCSLTDLGGCRPNKD